MRISTALILFSIALIAGRAYGQNDTVIKVPKGETEINIVLEMDICEPVTVKVEQCRVEPTSSLGPVVIQTPVPTIKATPVPTQRPTVKPTKTPRTRYGFW